MPTGRGSRSAFSCSHPRSFEGRPSGANDQLVCAATCSDDGVAPKLPRPATAPTCATSAATACQTAFLFGEPLLILTPVSADDLLLFFWRKTLDSKPASHVTGVLGRPDDVAIVSLGLFDLGAETLDASRRQLERCEMNAITRSVPTLYPVLVEQREYLRCPISGEVAPDYTFDISPRDRGDWLRGHVASQMPSNRSSTATLA